MDEDHLIVPSGDTEAPQEKSHIRNLLFSSFALFILTLADTMFNPVMSQYLYKRVSEEVFNMTNIPLSTNSCYINKTDPGYKMQEKAQETAASKQLQFTILQSALGFVSNMMLGVYSDNLGRKLLFLVPITGHFLMFSLTAVIIKCNLGINFFFLPFGLDGLMGSFYGILMAAFVYTADNTPPTGSRTIGIALAEVPYFVAAASMSTATGYFIQNTGFFYPALTSSLLCLIDLIIVGLFLPETRNIDRNIDRKRFISPLQGCKRVFGFYFFEGTRLKKACFIIAILSFVFNVLSMVGSSNISTLFLLNEPFCWNPEKLGYYTTAVSLIGPLVGIPFTRLLQCCVIDEIIAVISTATVIIADVIHSFASTDAMLFIVAGVGSFGSTLTGITRAILSRMVPRERQGSLFASIAVVETLCTLVGTSIFSNIYQQTVGFWRGFVFMAMAIAHVFGAIFLILYAILSRRLPANQQPTPVSIQAQDGELYDSE